MDVSMERISENTNYETDILKAQSGYLMDANFNSKVKEFTATGKLFAAQVYSQTACLEAGKLRELLCTVNTTRNISLCSKSCKVRNYVKNTFPPTCICRPVTFVELICSCGFPCLHLPPDCEPHEASAGLRVSRHSETPAAPGLDHRLRSTNE